jgi:hypothetical protein
MLFSTVTPASDSDLPNAIRVLSEQAQALGNLQGTRAEERLANYQAWASQASAQLRYVFDLPQVEAFINTQRHDFLIGKSWADTQLLINNSISAEQADRAKVFKTALDGLRYVERSCNDLPEFLIVPDTNVFLHQEQYFDELNWYEMVQVAAEFRVMLPMAVVRELDKGKRAQPGRKVGDTNSESVRTRARVSSRRLRDLFEDPRDVKKLGKRATVELLLDPVGHRHLEDPDSEIIERAVALKTVSRRQVLIVTGDGNMQFMADVAGLGAVALPD